MIGSLIHQIELMSLSDLYTAAFTAFIFCGAAACCFQRSDKGSEQRPVRRELTASPKITPHHARRRRTTAATVRVASRPRQLSLPLGRVAA
jgi:hypothetical protein